MYKYCFLCVPLTFSFYITCFSAHARYRVYENKYICEYPSFVFYGTFTLIMQINFNLKDLLIEIHNK